MLNQHLCCSAHIFVVVVSNQIDNWNHLYLSIFWNYLYLSILNWEVEVVPVIDLIVYNNKKCVQNSSELFLWTIIWHGGYGLLGALPWVWQSDSSFRHLPSRPCRWNLKMRFQALEFVVSCAVAKYIFFCCRRSKSSYVLIPVFLKMIS